MKSQGAKTREEPLRTISLGDYDAFVFDLDGVVTKTAKVHAAAWKDLFDSYLQERAEEKGEPFQSFDIDQDYREYVDGKPRYDGVKSFLDSRNIHLPWGDPGDDPGNESICALGNRKNRIFMSQLKRTPPEVYQSAVRLIRRLRRHGIVFAVVTASKNCDEVLEAASLSELFSVRVDGNDLERMSLQGKPAPDSYLEAARRLKVDPIRAVVCEDALAGVEAGRRGGFGLVVGVDRTGHSDELKNHGADIVVTSLSQINLLEERR